MASWWEPMPSGRRIFTGIGFEELDPLAFRKLFVGMTRARLKRIMVLSNRAAAVLLAQLIKKTNCAKTYSERPK